MLLLLLWGFYALRAGDLNTTLRVDDRLEPTDLLDAGTLGGLVVTFVWAYSDDSQAWGAVLGAVPISVPFEFGLFHDLLP